MLICLFVCYFYQKFSKEKFRKISRLKGNFRKIALIVRLLLLYTLLSSSLNQNSDFLRIFGRNCDFWKKNDFWPKFRFLDTITIFGQNFKFWPKSGYLKNEFWRKILYFCCCVFWLFDFCYCFLYEKCLI